MLGMAGVLSEREQFQEASRYLKRKIHKLMVRIGNLRYARYRGNYLRSRIRVYNNRELIDEKEDIFSMIYCLQEADGMEWFVDYFTRKFRRLYLEFTRLSV